MSIPATPITFTLLNTGTHDIIINSIAYEDDSRIQHVADYTGLGGPSGDTRPSTVDQYKKRYQYGDYLEKTYQSDTHDRTPTYTTMTGVTLQVSSVEGIESGWTVTTPGNGLTGRSVVSKSAPHTLIMDGTYSGIPIIGANVNFQAPYKEITVDNTTHLQAGWQIQQNGYLLSDYAFITSVVDVNTLRVNKLPNQSTVEVGNPMLFFTNTNYLTLNNDNNLDIGFTADGNGYNNSQVITLLVGDGQTVKMSAQPGSLPVYNGEITFTSNQSLVTIPVGSQVTFSINYTSPGPAGTNYASTVTIYAIQNSIPIQGKIYNYVTVDQPPPNATPLYVTIYNGGNGGRGLPGYTTTVTTFSDGSTMSVTTSNDTGQTTSIGSTDATDPGASLGDTTGISSVNSYGTSDPGDSGGGGGGGSSRVICTHFYRKGMISRDIWRADMEYTFNYLSPATVRGYQYWAIPYVKLMRKSPLAEKIMYPLMLARAEELAYQMGVLKKGNWAGKLVRLVFEPICFTIGLFVGEQNWKSLWNIKSDGKI